MLGALVTALGGIIIALIQLLGRRMGRVESKIDGLRNGTYSKAMAALAELRRERAERELKGLPRRRRIDHIIPEDRPK